MQIQIDIQIHIQGPRTRSWLKRSAQCKQQPPRQQRCRAMYRALEQATAGGAPQPAESTADNRRMEDGRGATEHVTQEAHAAHAAIARSVTVTVSDRRSHNAMQSECWGLRSDGTLGVRSGTKEHASREEGFFLVNDLLPCYHPATHAPPVLQGHTTAHVRGLLVDMKAAVSGETVFTSLLVDPDQEVRLLLRRLQYRTFKQNQDAEGTQIQLICNGHKLEPSMPLLQAVAQDNEAVVLQSIADDARENTRFELEMVMQPVLLSWTQLTTMPLMRKRTGRGAAGAHRLQRRLRYYCYEHNMREVDLSRSDYDWRLLLRNMPRMLKHFEESLLAGGVVAFRFCLLDQEDPNYADRRSFMHAHDTGDRHVFEICCADGHLCHMHFHRSRPCDVVHMLYDEAEQFG